MPYLAEALFIDSSAAIALKDPSDQFHSDARHFFESTGNVLWVILNATAHEAFTRARYNIGFHDAITLYDFLKGGAHYQLDFVSDDEREARRLLIKYSDHRLSFHDVLCAAVMKRVGIYKAFAFDHHFYYFGFQIFPGSSQQYSSS